MLFIENQLFAMFHILLCMLIEFEVVLSLRYVENIHFLKIWESIVVGGACMIEL